MSKYRVLLKLFAYILLSLGIATSALNISRATPAYSQTGDWSEAINVSGSPTSSNSPSLASDPEGGIHLVWIETFEQDNLILQYSRLEGDQWLPANDILPTGGSYISEPSLVSDSKGYLHIAYAASGVFYSRAFAPLAWSAQNWKDPQRLAPPLNALSRPRLAIDPDDNPNLVFANHVGPGSGIYFLSSSGGGENWDEPLLVYENASPDRMIDKPDIAIDARGRIHLVWVERNFPETFPPIGIRYSSSLDGISWDEPVSLIDGPYDDPKIIASGADEVHVVWSGTGEDRYKFHRWSKDGGQNWLAMWRNEALGGLQGYPALVEDGDKKLHWLQVGSVFSLQGSDIPNWDSLFENVFSNGLWTTGNILLKGSVQEQNMANISATIALGNELHVAVVNPLRTSDGNYQLDIIHLHRHLEVTGKTPKVLEIAQPTQTATRSAPPTPLTTVATPTLSIPLTSAPTTQSPLSSITIGALTAVALVILILASQVLRKVK